MAARRPLVLVALHRLEPEVLDSVQAACVAARADLVEWSGGVPSSAPTPALVIAGLARGERRIPADLIDLVTRVHAGLPLLLLSADPLIRSVVALHGGRVNVVSPPHDPARLAARLRVLLADRMRAPDTLQLFPAKPDETPLVRVREHLRPKWWLGRLGAWDPGGPSPENVLPRVHQAPTDGLTAILIPSPEAESSHVLAATVELMRSGMAEGELSRSLSELLGDLAAAIHLSPGGDTWSVYWPQVTGWTLWMFSPMRLPSWWNLSTSLEMEGRRLLRRQARSEDLLVAVTGPIPAAAELTGDADPELGGALAAGGPPLLDLLADRYRAAPRDAVGLLVEVR